MLTVFGGVVADRVDRRKLLLWTQSNMALIALVLAILTATELIQVWHLIVAAFLWGALQAFDSPSRMALVPQLVERDDLMNAIAMQSMIWQGTRIIGPAVGGLLIGTVGTAACFISSRPVWGEWSLPSPRSGRSMASLRPEGKA